MLTGPLICLGLVSLLLPILVYKKVNKYLTVNSNESLKKMSIDDLVFINLTAHSSTKEVNTLPLKEPSSAKKE